MSVKFNIGPHAEKRINERLPVSMKQDMMNAVRKAYVSTQTSPTIKYLISQRRHAMFKPWLRYLYRLYGGFVFVFIPHKLKPPMTIQLVTVFSHQSVENTKKEQEFRRSQADFDDWFQA